MITRPYAASIYTTEALKQASQAFVPACRIDIIETQPEGTVAFEPLSEAPSEDAISTFFNVALRLSAQHLLR